MRPRLLGKSRLPFCNPMVRLIRQWKDASVFPIPQGAWVSNGLGRQYMAIHEESLREEAFSKFGFFDLKDEPTYKNFVGNHFLSGAFTHKHKDIAPNGYIHVRANWMLKKPPIGGNPVLDDVEIDVKENDLWVCFASEESHASTAIQDGERLICSFGALIKKPKNFNLKDIVYG